MKSLTLSFIAGIMFGSIIFGCKSEHAIKWNGELPPLGMEYPELLPSENAHQVTLHLRRYPSLLTKDDIAEIVRLISLVPGMRTYTIEIIEKSSFHPNCVEVPLPPYMVILEKGKRWCVRKLGSYDAD